MQERITSLASLPSSLSTISDKSAAVLDDGVIISSSPLVSAVLTSIIINIATFAILFYQEQWRFCNFKIKLHLKVPGFYFFVLQNKHSEVENSNTKIDDGEILWIFNFEIKYLIYLLTLFTILSIFICFCLCIAVNTTINEIVTYVFPGLSRSWYNLIVDRVNSEFKEVWGQKRTCQFSL